MMRRIAACNRDALNNSGGGNKSFHVYADKATWPKRSRDPMQIRRWSHRTSQGGLAKTPESGERSNGCLTRWTIESFDERRICSGVVLVVLFWRCIVCLILCSIRIHIIPFPHPSLSLSRMNHWALQFYIHPTVCDSVDFWYYYTIHRPNVVTGFSGWTFQS